MLELDTVRAGYRGGEVLSGITLNVEPGARVGVLGRNGVGKSTLLKTIIGQVPLQGGRIRFDQRDIGRLPSHVRARSGIGLVAEGRQIFPAMSVQDNLLIGAYATKQGATAELLDTVFDQFPVLAERSRQPGGSLSGGEQQMLALGRALMTRPHMILMDEPTEGVQPSIVKEMAAKLVELSGALAIGLLLVDQNLDFVRSVVQKVHLIDRGRVAVSGTPSDLLDDERTVQRYLGV